MIVTRIVKKGKKDVTIHFDDDKFLILALEVFLKSGLKKGDELSDDRFSFLIEQNKLFHIKQKAFRLLGRRQHASSELRRKLWQRDYEQELIDKVVDDLLIDFLGTRLDLYIKLTEPEVNMFFKSKWFENFRQQAAVT